MRLLIAAVLFVFMAGSSFGQEIPGSDVPAPVYDKFEASYGKVVGQVWYKNDKGYKVKFENQGKKLKVHYDQNGTWLKTYTQITQAELPQTVQTSVANNSGEYSIKKAFKVDYPSKEVMYKVKFKVPGQKDLKKVLFEADGSFAAKK